MCTDNLNLVWRNAPYKGAQLLVLVAIADWSGEHGEFNYSVRSLAARCRMDERSIQRYMAQFQADKVLSLVAESSAPGITRTYKLGVTYCHPYSQKGVTENGKRGDTGVTPNKENVTALNQNLKAPYPTFASGAYSDRRPKLTRRDIRILNKEIERILRRDVGVYGMTDDRAFEIACSNLLIPLDMAREATRSFPPASADVQIINARKAEK